MEYRRFGDTLVIRMDPGEEIVAGIAYIAEKENISLANVSGLGALNYMETGLFDTTEKKFIGHEYEEALEVTSLTGTITRQDKEPYLHLHMSAGKAEGTVVGGHLKKAVVSATAIAATVNLKK